MGTIYSVTCHDCKVTRDLNKFYSAFPVATRDEALKYCERIKKDSFRAGLLVSFMAEHQTHKCTFFSEHDMEWEEYSPFENDLPVGDPFYGLAQEASDSRPANQNGYKNDTDFWDTSDNGGCDD